MADKADELFIRLVGFVASVRHIYALRKPDWKSTSVPQDEAVAILYRNSNVSGTDVLFQSGLQKA